MVDYFKAGGFWMWFLLGTALVGVAYVIERFITYALSRINVKKFITDLKVTLREKGIDAGIEVCMQEKSPVARIIESTLESYKKIGPQKDALEESVIRAGTTELAFLDRGLPILAAVSTIAPIIGFLGTVTGMIHAFQSIAIAGEVEATLVATGISEALITTATGLAIAFPIVGFHVYFTARSNAYTRMMETAATDFITFLIEEKPR